MPKKSKKKAGKKSAKKAAVKKTAKKKIAKKSAARPAKKSIAKSVGSRGSIPKVAVENRTPPLCTQNFPARNGDTVNFTGMPNGGTQIQQVGSVYPFSPISGYNGNPPMAYTSLPLPRGQQLVVAVPAINQTYPYGVTTCPGLGGNHSVTVNS